MDLGMKIRQLRKAAGLTQAELGAKAFDVPPSVGQTRVNRIEHGVKSITDEELQALKDALHALPSEFIGLVSNRDILEDLDATTTVLQEYPEMESLRNMLAFAISRKDSYLIFQAWKIIHEYATQQIRKLEDQCGDNPTHK